MKFGAAPRPARLLPAPWCTALPAASRRLVLARTLGIGAGLVTLLKLGAGLAAGSSALLLSEAAHAQPKETFLPTPTSLREAALLAQSKGEPLVLLVSLPGCVWCELLRRNYLAPMRNEGVHVFQITVNDKKQVVDNFQGQPSQGADIATAYRAKFTPTLMFFNAQGQEIAKRIEGVASLDMIGALIDARLAAARQQTVLTPRPAS
jgi:Thioredoxin-like domain